MAASFLHGFEFIESALFHPVQMVRSSVIGLVGASPIGPTNQLPVVKNRTDAVRIFGELEAGWTIPQALAAILDQGDEIGFVVCVNVFDPAAHLTDVVDEAKTFDATKHTLALAHRHVSSVVVKSTDGLTTYTVGTDYT